MIKTLGAMAALVAAIIGVGYWVQSVNARLATLEGVQPADAKSEKCRELADRLPKARGKTKAGIQSAMSLLGCSK